jgi:hypothetical protein
VYKLKQEAAIERRAMISPRAEQVVENKKQFALSVAILNYYHHKWMRRKQKQIHRMPLARATVFLLICMGNKELIRFFVLGHAEHN